MQKTDVSTQKINGSLLETYYMVIAIFQVLDKFDQSRFFKKTFLLTDIGMKIVFDTLFWPLLILTSNLQKKTHLKNL